jgi:3-isopropylmalate dehydrogenase
MKKHIVVLPGDGIGPEITTQAVAVLNKVAAKFNHEFTFTEIEFGGASIDKNGVPLTPECIAACKASDSVLLGAIGGPKWNGVDKSIRPERGLLQIRKELNLFANPRPTKLFPQLRGACPLKDSIIDKGIDFVVVRELTGGIYFGKRRTEVINGERVATDEMTYSEHEIERIGRVAFETALKRNKKVCSVDKENVLDSSRLWREVMTRVSRDYPTVEYSDMLVDNAAMQIISKPSQFDVIVTENMFGDILSDEASTLAGSLGMMPSASLSDTSLGLYEPIHGSAPDIAGQDKANPLGTIMSAAMMLRLSFNMSAEADAIEAAINKVLDDGYRTGDIMSEGMKLVTCSQMGKLVADAI